MSRMAFRLMALVTMIGVTSPAWAGWLDVDQWLPELPQPSALGIMGLGVLGLVVGRYASRKRGNPSDQPPR
jgi:hypothetical protein